MPLQARRKSRSTALPMIKLGEMLGWLMQSWVGHEAGLDGCEDEEIPCPQRDSNTEPTRT
jgi:hypothetical protein